MLGAMVLLLLAIATEIVATAMLSRADGFTDPGWSAFVLAGYGVSIWLLALVVRTMPVSVAYAVWSGLGTALVVAIGWAFLGESMTWVKGVSLTLIVVGVVGVNLAQG